MRQILFLLPKEMLLFGTFDDAQSNLGIVSMGVGAGLDHSFHLPQEGDPPTELLLAENASLLLAPL